MVKNQIFINSFSVLLVEFIVKSSVADCPALKPPINGGLSGSCGTRIGNICRLYCKKNCELVGDRVRKCLPNSTWSGSPTYCVNKNIYCGQLNPPNNGYQVGNCRHRVGCVCHFACNSGYILSGSPQVSCQQNGQWSTLPTCIGTTTTTTTTTTTCGTIGTTDSDQNTQVYCPSLGVPTNGVLRGSCGVSPPASICTFSCNTGYQLVGNSVRVCAKNGKWTNTIVTCSLIRLKCPTLAPPRHGALYGYCSPGLPGEECDAICNSGYTLVGTSSLTCQSSGKWSASVPVCRRT